jgi:hypothetical protein
VPPYLRVPPDRETGNGFFLDWYGGERIEERFVDGYWAWFVVYTGINVFFDLVAAADLPPTNPPQPPLGVLAHGGSWFVRLEWMKSIGATGYKIYRAPSQNGLFEVVGAVGDVDEWTDADRPPGSTQFYRVTALSPESAPSGSVGKRLWTGGRMYYDKDTQEVVNGVTGARVASPGAVHLDVENRRRDWLLADGRVLRDLPKRRSRIN